MPHEPGVRRWLRRRGQSPEDVDDLIQEAYAKLAGVTAPEQIAQPSGYCFQIVRNLMIDSSRRARVVRIDEEAAGWVLRPDRDDTDSDVLTQLEVWLAGDVRRRAATMAPA